MTAGCLETEFRCHSTSRCISVSLVCNGVVNCADFSDESTQFDVCGKQLRTCMIVFLSGTNSGNFMLFYLTTRRRGTYCRLEDFMLLENGWLVTLWSIGEWIEYWESAIDQGARKRLYPEGVKTLTLTARFMSQFGTSTRNMFTSQTFLVEE